MPTNPETPKPPETKQIPLTPDQVRIFSKYSSEIAMAENSLKSFTLGVLTSNGIVRGSVTKLDTTTGMLTVVLDNEG